MSRKREENKLTVSNYEEIQTIKEVTNDVFSVICSDITKVS